MASVSTKVVRGLSQANHLKKHGIREFSAMLTPTEEFPGLPSTSPVAAASASSASVTTLPNGLTVVSETGAFSSTISLTYPSAGSSNESSSESGAALANKFLSFKSGSGLSSAVILRNLENAGAKPFSSVDKSKATVGFTAAKDQAIRLIPLIATNCDFAKWDVKDAQQAAASASKDASSNLMTVLSDAIYSAAYGAQTPLGKSLYNSNATTVALQSFRQKNYGLNGAVLAATGIDDHQAFVQAVEHLLSESHVGDGQPSTLNNSTFLAGETRISAPSLAMAHVALVFQAPKNVSPVLDIAQQCIQLSSSTSVQSFSSSKHGNIGLVTSSTDGAAAIDTLCSIMTNIPSAEIINRAKNLAKANALLTIDSANDSQSLASIMTHSVLESGSFSYSSVAAAYDAVTVDQVRALFTSVGSTVPALAAIGDLTNVPYHGSVASKFSK